ncbi:FUN14 family-domain-containing protein [Cerioporus squamosus]|nr:FUN14 family-domain-containing protein [Cerioporus squamosus]
MLPVLPSLLSRQVYGTLRRTPCASSPSSTKAFFSPNFHRGGCTLRPYVHSARPPSSSLASPPRSAAAAFSRKEFYRAWAGGIMKLGFAGVGLALTFLAAPILYCDPIQPKKVAETTPPAPNSIASSDPYPLPPPPQSSINLYELSFGTVCGVCAGVFVKKGARFVAFALGGIFVVLQYFGSLSLLRVDWSRAAGRFENLFYTKDASGVSRPPNVGSLFRWIVNFLTADFPPRATFIAGFVLGLRIG